MKKIEKKTWPKYFQAILDGTKTFDLRLADFDCSVGDMLVLREWDPQTKEYTGRQVERIVKYVAKSKNFNYGSKEDIDNYGFQVMSF